MCISREVLARGPAGKDEPSLLRVMRKELGLILRPQADSCYGKPDFLPVGGIFPSERFGLGRTKAARSSSIRPGAGGTDAFRPSRPRRRLLVLGGLPPLPRHEAKQSGERPHPHLGTHRHDCSISDYCQPYVEQDPLKDSELNQRRSPLRAPLARHHCKWRQDRSRHRPGRP